MQLNVWSRTDLGNVRENNEDAHFVDAENGLFVLADGVGGSVGGEIASGRLVEFMGEKASELAALARAGNPVLDRAHREEVFRELLNQIQAANAEIYELGKEVDEVRPPATTCDAVLLVENAAFIAHVGDSRVYLVRGEEIFRITEDHTFSEQLRREEIGDTDVLERYRNVLTRSIGGRPTVDVDALFIDVRPGDYVLLASDGLTDYLSGSELLEFTRLRRGARLAEALVEEAKSRGGKDNITVVLVEVAGIDQTIRDTASFDTLRQVDILGDIELFAGLGMRDLLKIMRVVYEITLEDGALVPHNEPGERCMYIVAEGEIELLVDGQKVGHLQPGQHFGELVLVSEEPRKTEARCVGETLLLAVPAGRFRSIVTDDPAVGNVLLWNLLETAIGQIRRLAAEVASARSESV